MSLVRTIDEVVGGALAYVTGRRADAPKVDSKIDSALGELVRWTGLVRRAR
jgi:hypothetical protein